MFLKYGCRTVSASAFMTLTPAIVRVACRHPPGRRRHHRLPEQGLRKGQPREVAEPFMRPPTQALLDQCVAEGWLTADEAALAVQVPMAEDITAEATSAGTRTAGRWSFCCRRSSDSATA